MFTNEYVFMYILPLLHKDKLKSIALKDKQFHWVSDKQLTQQEILRWIRKKTLGKKEFVFYDLEDLLQLNAIAIACRVDISNVSHGDLTGILQYAHSIARLQSIFRKRPTIYDLARLIGYPNFTEIPKRNSLLFSLSKRKYETGLKQLVNAIEFLHWQLRSYLTAGRRLRGQHLFW